MNDSRLRTASALADDARCLLVELLEELPCLPASHFISQAHASLNRAIENLTKAYSPEPTQGDAA